MTEEDICSEFNGICDLELISRCLRICHTYRLSASDLATDWGLLKVQGKVQALTIESLAVLERAARDAYVNKQAKSTKQQFTHKSKTSTTFNAESAQALLNNVLGSGTPVRGGGASATTTPRTVQASTPPSGGAGAFATRQDAGKVLCTLNPELGFVSSFSQLELQSTQTTPSLPGDAHMYVKLEKRAELMDAQLVAFEREVATRTDLPPVVSLLDNGAEEVTVVGRVCCEGEGRLNLQSIFLEGPRGEIAVASG